MTKPDNYKDGGRMIKSEELRKPIIGRYIKVDGKDVFIKKQDNE